jgi:hypothetical protein
MRRILPNVDVDCSDACPTAEGLTPSSTTVEVPLIPHSSLNDLPLAEESLDPSDQEFLDMPELREPEIPPALASHFSSGDDYPPFFTRDLSEESDVCRLYDSLMMFMSVLIYGLL